jgi:hypothetical protein
MSGPNSKLRRFVVNSMVVWPMLWLYMLINHCQAAPSTTVPMPSWMPFWPAFLPVYMALMLVTWLLPVVIEDAGRFRACLRANVCAWLLVMPWWIFSPTVMPRPALPEGVWAYAFNWLWTVDLPYNVRPCAHGMGPVIVAWFVAQERPRWRWPLVWMLGVGLSSIAFVWQHRPVDILLGTVAAGLGIAIGETLSRREQVSFRKSLRELSS